MGERNLTPDEILAMAESMGHQVDDNRLTALTEGVNQLNAKLAMLNTLELGDCERAETINLLSIQLDDLSEP